MNILEHHRHPVMQLLRKAIRKERNFKLFFATLAMAVAIFFIVIPADTALIQFLFYLTGIAFLYASFNLFKNVIRYWDVHRSPLLQLLYHDKEQIVWIYGIIKAQSPFGIHVVDNGSLYFKLANKEEIIIDIPANKLKKVSTFLNPFLPHTTFGYTEERAQWYIANPDLLRK